MPQRTRRPPMKSVDSFQIYAFLYIRKSDSNNVFSIMFKKKFQPNFLQLFFKLSRLKWRKYLITSVRPFRTYLKSAHYGDSYAITHMGTRKYTDSARFTKTTNCHKKGENCMWFSKICKLCRFVLHLQVRKYEKPYMFFPYITSSCVFRKKFVGKIRINGCKSKYSNW